MRFHARGVMAAAVLLPIVMTACAGHLPPCPAAGGPAWTELQSPHFRLRTDEPPDAARAVLTDLEQFQAALLKVFGVSPDLDTGKLPVVVVDRGWTDFAPRQTDGFFTHALFQPLIVMLAGSELARQRVIKHELVHYLSHKVIPHQPPWLAEGLATYYETIEYDATAARLTVGRPSPERLRGTRGIGVANIETMFAVKAVTSDDDMGAFYAAAWITTHYLVNHRAMALVGYQKALRAGASPEAAWTAAFGAQTQAQLASDVRRYLDGGQYEVLIYRFPPPHLAAPGERPLTDADTHATRALLYLTGRRTRASVPELSLGFDDPRLGARRELDEALRQEPAHVKSHAIAHWMMGAPVDLEQATTATRKSGDDWLAWLLLAEALEQHNDEPGYREAVTRAIEIARTDRSVKFTVTPFAGRGD